MSGNDIYIGTSGWSYDHWKGVFYPEKIAANRMLAEYVRHLRTAEINSVFYRLPSEKMVEQWLQSTPTDFVFAVKASRYITHVKKLNEPEDSVAALLAKIGILGEKLGPLLFQLPPHWHCNEERFTVFLNRLPAGFRYSFEFRDHSWLNERVNSLLADHNAAFCIYELDGYLSPKEVTADFLYVRLHGPGGPYQGSYDQDVLAAWANFFLHWARRGKRVYCYFDNDEKGYAPLNARTLQEMVTGMQKYQC